MTTLSDTPSWSDQPAGGIGALPELADPTTPTTPMGPRAARWPWWAVVAGVTGLAANLTSMGATTADRDPDPLEVVENLPRLQYHVSFVLGLACAASLVVAIAALRPWIEQRGGGRLSASVVPPALSITATLAVIAACMAGSLALYLPGGVDDGTMWIEGLAAAYYYLDFGALIGWWGAMLAAICTLPMTMGERRVLPRWLGVVTIVLVALPALVAAATGLPGLPGLTMPVWLIAFGVALTRRAG